MKKVSGVDVPPPGDGVDTITWAVPAVAMSLAEIIAVSWVALTKLVVRLAPFHWIVDPEMKLAPVTVKVKAGFPALTLIGDMELTLGVGFAAVMVKARLFDTPPPGAGLVTVTWALPGDLMSAALIEALSCVALTKVVLRLLPFHCTVALGTKFEPFTVRVKLEVPAVALAGNAEVMTGLGLLIEKPRGPEVPPPGAGLATVTFAVPAVAMSLDEIVAVIWLALTKLVVRLLPFHCTVDPCTKPEPLTVRVNPGPPAIELDGATEVPIGPGLLMENTRGAEVPPPGAGVNTVIWTVPAVAMSLDEIAAVIWVALAKLVGRLLPFHCRTAEETKLEPVTVRVKAAPPAIPLGGETDAIVGTGLGLCDV
jgi:hypothetical protein